MDGWCLWVFNRFMNAPQSLESRLERSKISVLVLILYLKAKCVFSKLVGLWSIVDFCLKSLLHIFGFSSFTSGTCLIGKVTSFSKSFCGISWGLPNPHSSEEIVHSVPRRGIKAKDQNTSTMEKCLGTQTHIICCLFMFVYLVIFYGVCNHGIHMYSSPFFHHHLGIFFIPTTLSRSKPGGGFKDFLLEMSQFD